jgi:chromosome segregation ATPase
MFNKIAEKARLKKRFREEIMKEKIDEITQLENEKKEIQEKLKEKERELYRYKFKIKDLQKTKQVLTHRTQEMKASLEPKEQQIENLKEQLLDLENVFNKQLTALHNLEFVVIPKKK